MPCNLMSWPEVRDLLPDQKLIVYHLWATSPSSAGCWLFDLAAGQAALSIARDALRDALREFERRGLLLLDEKTGEIYIKKWFRWHTFDTAPRKRVLESDVARIESESLLIIIESDMKTIRCKPREVKGSKGKPLGGKQGEAVEAKKRLDEERERLAGRVFEDHKGAIFQVSACGASVVHFDKNENPLGIAPPLLESFVEAVRAGRLVERR